MSALVLLLTWPHPSSLQEEEYADVAAAAPTPETGGAAEPAVVAELDEMALDVELPVDGDAGADAPGGLDVPAPPVVAPARWTPADVHAALRGASARAQCIVRVEVAGVGYDPYAVGRQGELGIAQLHPRGLYPDFLRQGYSDAFNPYESVDYVERALARGLAPHWAGVRLGRC